MNLLPKSEVKFAEKDYWDSFFKNRNNKEFEWYGEYPELCSHLHKYIKQQDSALVVGCGNSSLSANLYDVGYRNIVNIDVSTVVIKQMKQLHRDRKEMKYEVMDALNTKFENESFSVVLDKGTLDALMPQDTNDDKARGRGLLEEAARLLKFGGRYIVISLLQPHILKLVLDVYVNLGWLIRVCRCHEVEERTTEEMGQLRMPVFMVVCTKFRKMEGMKSILELNLGAGDEPTRVEDAEEIITTVKEIQNATAMCGAIQKEALKGEVELEFRREGDKTPRYSINVVDPEGASPKIRKYGAFIVPRGRETEWHFGSPEGRQLLQKSSGFDRLAVISLRRDHIYPSMEEIQRELGDSIVQLAPKGAPQHIPFLTIGEGLGAREIIFEGHSEHSGDFVVEDVDVFSERFRRLIFLRNQGVIQSEMKLKLVKKKKDKKGAWQLDSSHVACSHHRYMGIAVALHSSQPSSVLVLGLGGGGLCTFLQKMFSSLTITAVDIDPAVIDVSKKYFGIVPDDKLLVEAMDGLKFLETCKKNCKYFDVIILDMDSKEEGKAMSSPPAVFVTSQALDTLSVVLAESGTLVINMVSRVEPPKKMIVDDLRTRYPLVARYSLEEDVNELVFASRRKDFDQLQWRSALEEAANRINKDGRKNLFVKENLLDMYHLLENLKIT